MNILIISSCLLLFFYIEITNGKLLNKRKINERSKLPKSNKTNQQNELNIKRSGKFLTKATSENDTAYYNQFNDVDDRIKAEVVRKLLRTVNGAAISTKFRNTEFPSYTYPTIQMIADINNTKYGGIPYFLMNHNDSAYRDLLADNRGTALLTDSSTGTCNYWSFGSKDKNCHRAVFLGPFVDASWEESDLALPEFVKRYPGVKNLNLSDYFIAKIDTKAIFIGEAERLSLVDFYRARPYGWDITADQGTKPPVFPERSIFMV